MRIALRADMHGNLIAFATVLQGVPGTRLSRSFVVGLQVVSASSNFVWFVFVNDTSALSHQWYSAVESQEIVTRDLVATNVLC